MNRSQRDTAVRVFMSKDKAKIMLMSLKCGGVGLNLVRANRVISLDLGWSEAIESQAFDRVHRLGQQRDVFVERMVIKNTVEDRVLALQERKKGLADGSLGEGNGKKVGRLSVKELANRKSSCAHAVWLLVLIPGYSVRSGPSWKRPLDSNRAAHLLYKSTIYPIPVYMLYAYGSSNSLVVSIFAMLFTLLHT